MPPGTRKDRCDVRIFFWKEWTEDQSSGYQEKEAHLDWLGQKAGVLLRPSTASAGFRDGVCLCFSGLPRGSSRLLAANPGGSVLGLPVRVREYAGGATGHQ